MLFHFHYEEMLAAKLVRTLLRKFEKGTESRVSRPPVTDRKLNITSSVGPITRPHRVSNFEPDIVDRTGRPKLRPLNETVTNKSLIRFSNIRTRLAPQS